jgi:hypothetical protein
VGQGLRLTITQTVPKSLDAVSITLWCPLRSVHPPPQRHYIGIVEQAKWLESPLLNGKFVVGDRLLSRELTVRNGSHWAGQYRTQFGQFRPHDQ